MSPCQKAFCALPRASGRYLIEPHPWGSTLRAFSLPLEVQFLLSCKNCRCARNDRPRERRYRPEARGSAQMDFCKRVGKPSCHSERSEESVLRIETRFFVACGSSE